MALAFGEPSSVVDLVVTGYEESDWKTGNGRSDPAMCRHKEVPMSQKIETRKFRLKPLEIAWLSALATVAILGLSFVVIGTGASTVDRYLVPPQILPGLGVLYFFAVLTAISTATTTRDGQRSQLDGLVTKWANTASYPGGLLAAATVSITYNLPSGITVAQYTNMINVLEAFNGSRFYGNAEGGPRPAGFAVQSATDPIDGHAVYHYIISPPAQQVALLQQAYEALKESVYASLVVQTRLKPYLDLESKHCYKFNSGLRNICGGFGHRSLMKSLCHRPRIIFEN